MQKLHNNEDLSNNVKLVQNEKYFIKIEKLEN